MPSISGNKKNDAVAVQPVTSVVVNKAMTFRKVRRKQGRGKDNNGVQPKIGVTMLICTEDVAPD